jgi:translation initiation factor 3 subunit C
MSRFFATGSDSESASSESDVEMPQKPVVAAKTFQMSDDDEETKRVVRSGKDKRFEEMQTIIKALRNHKKIKDMSSMCNDYEDLQRAFDKANKLTDKGDPKDWPPQFFLRCLVEVDDFVNECWADQEGRKALSKNNARGLTTLKQKCKKYIRDYKFDVKLAEYRQKREEGQLNDEEDDQQQRADEDESDESSDEDEEDRVIPSTSKEDVSKFLKKTEESDTDSSDMWERSSESSSESSDDEARPLGTLTADFFRKKQPAEGEADARRKKKDEEKKTKKIRRAKSSEESDNDEADGGGSWEQVKGGVIMAVQEKPKLFAKDEKIDHKKVDDKLRELVAGRGKKGTDRNRHIEALTELRKMAQENNLGEALDCKILFCLIAAIYDYNPNIAASMKPEMWEKCLEHVRELLDILTKNSETIIAREYVAEETENEKFTKPPPYHIRGCMLTVVERMDEEFVKMLQACDAHSTEYIVRLKDETTVCKIIEDLENYLRIQGQVTDEELCRVYLKRIQHIYYKFDHGTVSSAAGNDNNRTVMDRLCKFIYTKDSTDRIRTRAILCHIYHHALHDRWYEARDLMLMSHLQDNIQHSDIPTQILYNRSMVQLGICAFRQGLIKDAHSCLVDIQSSARAKELLAQGLLLQRQHERTAEQEKIEKRRQMPYHMHINLELLECVYLVSAMLLEIPYMAAHEFDARRRMISKNFHHVLRVSERQPLVGPPESMREHVVAACKAMKVGDWKACCDYIINDKMNAKVWDLFYNAKAVREMIKSKIQEESLRTYLFSYSSVYDSLSLDILAQMFELDKSVVHSTISKMIINEELMASMDEPTQAVVMHRTEPTRLQSLALQLAEKMASLVEQNERMLEMKTNGPGYFTYQRQGQQGGGYQQYQQQGYGRRQGQRGGREGGGGRYQQYRQNQQD